MGFLDFLFDIFIGSDPVYSKKQVENISIKFKDDNAIYTGEAAEIYGSMKPHGNGIAKIENGDVFSGEFKEGNPQKGVYTFENGSYCNVDYSENKVKYSAPYGYRKAKELNKKTEYDKEYIGELKNDVPDGIGTMHFFKFNFFGFKSGEDVYKGGFKNGKKHGVGRYEFKNGEYDICVYINGKEIECLEEYKKEEKIEEKPEKTEKPHISYAEESFKETLKKGFSDYVRDGNYEAALRQLNNFDYDEDITAFEGSYHSTRTAEEWKEELNERIREEKEDEADY